MSRARLPHVLFALFVATALSALVWPVYAWAGDRIEPRVLGLPFAFAWHVLWVVASFFALLLYDRAVQREER